MGDPAPSVVVNISCQGARSLWGHLFAWDLSHASTQTVQNPRSLCVRLYCLHLLHGQSAHSEVYPF